MSRTLDDINLVPEPTAKYLEPRQTVRYKQFRVRIRDWMANMGKAPSRGEGYSESTVYMRMTRLDKSMRWIWRNETDGFTLQITPAHADAYMSHLAQADYGRSYKADLQKAMKTLFRYNDVDWEPTITFSDPPSSNVTNRILTLEEWRAVREAAADYGAWIDYHTVSPEERSALNRVLAKRLDKARSAVGPADWQDAPSYKFASMFWLGMDGGLRPALIGRMRLHWIDLENQMIHIPAEHAVKNNEDWSTPFLDETRDFLRLWLEERECFSKYDNSDRVWLTKYGNPYASESINHHWRKIRDAAGIEVGGRDLPYYCIRHTQGTNIGEQIGLAGTAGQLRQKDQRSAEKYQHARMQQQVDALNNTR